MIATASKSTTAKSLLDSCLLCTPPKYVNDCRLTLNPLQRGSLFVRHAMLSSQRVGVGEFLSWYVRSTQFRRILCVFCRVFFFFAQIGHVRCIINTLTCSEALGSKLELLKVSFVSEFQKETWTQRKQQQIDRSFPESLRAMLEYWYIERGILLFAT